jgi:DNA-binding CsgD family transcriptional regulator
MSGDVIRRSDGEDAYQSALRAFTQKIAETDPGEAAALIGGAYGSEDEIRAAAHLGQIRALVDYLEALCASPDTYARAADLSPQALGRLSIAVEAIASELAQIQPSGWALLPGAAYASDPDPSTKPVLNGHQAATLLCIASGHDAKEIANRRGIGERAVNDTLKKCRQLLGANNTTHAAFMAHQSGEFTYYRNNVAHKINRAKNRTRQQIEADEFAADVWRWQRKLREEGFHKWFYKSGDARSTSAPTEPLPEEATGNPGIHTPDQYVARLTSTERHTDEPDDNGVAFGAGRAA